MLEDGIVEDGIKKTVTVDNGDHLKTLQDDLRCSDARYTVWEPLVKDQQQEAGN